MSVLGVIAASIAAVEVAQIVDRVAFEAEPGALFGRQSGQHLVEYVVILLLIQRTYHARLIQKVAVDLGPIQRPIRHLHFDKMTLKKLKSIKLTIIEMNSQLCTVKTISIRLDDGQLLGTQFDGMITGLETQKRE